MKYIFINRFAWPDHSATSQILSDLAFYLAGKGLEVHVVASRQIYDDPSANLESFELIKGVQIHRVWSASFGRQNLLGRFLDYLSFYLSAFIKLLLVSNRGAVIVAMTDPPLLSVMAQVGAKIRGAKLVTWLQDLFPEVAQIVGVRGVSGGIAGILKGLRNWSLNLAKMNVVIGEGMAKKLIAEGIPAQKIKVIHNWSDGDLVYPKSLSESRLRREWGLSDKFIVVYSGNMGRAHQFSAILDAAKEFSKDTRIIFLMIGGGPQKNFLETQVANLGLSNVLFKDYQPYELLGDSLAAANVHLISLNPKLEGLIVPSKFYGILASGRPCLYLGDSKGELAGIIEDEKCGLVIKDGGSLGLVSAIQHLAEHPNECIDMGVRARQLYDKSFSKSIAMRNWEDVLVKVNQTL